MAHVELSVSEPGLFRSAGPPADVGSELDRWSRSVSESQQPCVLLDAAGRVAAASPACARFFACPPAAAVGCRFVDVLLRLLDFGGVPAELPDREVARIPPLLVLTTGSLSRGLLRLVCDDGTTCIVDAVSTPLRDGPRITGSLTFLAPVGR